MEKGICKLCHEERDLQDSHFVPAAIYKVCRDVENNKDAITVTGGLAVQKSGQISDYVLCSECEKRFNEKGEQWVSQNIATPEGFPLQAAIGKFEPKVSGKDIAMYAGVEIKEIDTERLVYFALSIFWRGSVHRWNNPITGNPMPGIKLGEFEEDIRQFLLTGKTLPKNIAVLVTVWPSIDPPPLLAFHTPVSEVAENFIKYNFYVPGLDFKLVLGKKVPENILRMCTSGSPERMIFASITAATQTMDAYVTNVLRSKPLGKLGEQFKK